MAPRRMYLRHPWFCLRWVWLEWSLPAFLARHAPAALIRAMLYRLVATAARQRGKAMVDVTYRDLYETWER